MVLVWTGYGALQLAYIKNELSHHLIAYNIASIGLCLAIIVFSILWIAMAKGSKFIQEAHEAHIKSECKITDYLYCDLNEYEKGIYDTKDNKVKDKVSFCCPLKSYRFSPSKINIALGWTSLIFAWILLAFHTVEISGIWDFINNHKRYLLLVPCIVLLATYFLKGGEKALKHICCIILALVVFILCVVLVYLLPNKKLALNENCPYEQNIYNALIEHNKTINSILVQQNATMELIKSIKANLRSIQVNIKKVQEYNKCPNVNFNCYPSQQ